MSAEAAAVDRVMDIALGDAYERLERAIERGTVTREQVTSRLYCWDVQEGWSNWCAEADS